MTRRFKTVSSLQHHLRDSIVNSIRNQVADVCIRVVQENLRERVYDSYIPQGEFAYDRTYELLNSVTIGNIDIGTKYITFEIFMDTDKINAYRTGDGEWNQHGDIQYIQDVSEYIPLWVEEGTSGSLWDRDGSHYMEASHYELSGGQLARALSDALRSKGWSVTQIS